MKKAHSDPIEFDDPRIDRFLRLWHEQLRAGFERAYPNLDYNGGMYAKIARDRHKYIAFDDGTSGRFLLDKSTSLVWGIKAYGVRHPGKRIGHIDQIIKNWSTEVGEAVTA